MPAPLAGVGWQTCNDFSLGVELEGTGDTPFTDAQYARLGELAHTRRQPAGIVEMTGHEHILRRGAKRPWPLV